MRILQNDPTLICWILNVDRMHAGDFLQSIARAAQHADFENYELMRPLLLELQTKYPEYDSPVR